MFFEDLFIAPAVRAVEFYDHRRAVFLAHLIHPVLKTVQLQQPAIAEKTGGIDGIQHVVRGQ